MKRNKEFPDSAIYKIQSNFRLNFQSVMATKHCEKCGLDHHKMGDLLDDHIYPNLDRNSWYLAKTDADGRLRFYYYSTKETVGRFVHDGLTKLWKDACGFDLDVIVRDRVFRCHKTVMAAMSDYIRTCLIPGPQDSGEINLIRLDCEEVSPEVFEKILKFIYEGKDFVNNKNAQEVLEAAVFLQMECLESRCVDMMTKNMTPSSCLQIWDWAERNKSDVLSARARNVALLKFQTLRKTPQFLRLSVDRLMYLLGHDGLVFNYDDDLLEAILDWVDADRQKRRRHLQELLPFVCFPHLATEYLNELRHNDLIGQKTEFFDYIDEALTYHLAALQKGGRKIQEEIMARQSQTLKRMMPYMRKVVVFLGGTVLADEPLTNLIAFSPNWCVNGREMSFFSIASFPRQVGLGFGTAVWKNDIYVSGGSRSLDTLMVYRASENTWHDVRKLPMGRENHAMLCIAGKLYLLGGRNHGPASGSNHRLLSQISVYDVDKDEWQEEKYELVVAVEDAPAVVYGDKIFLFGGKGVDGEACDLVQCLDPSTGEVSVAGQLPVPAEGAKAIVSGRDVILITPEGSIFKISEESGPHHAVKSEVQDSHEDQILTSLDYEEMMEDSHLQSNFAQNSSDEEAGSWTLMSQTSKKFQPSLKDVTSKHKAFDQLSTEAVVSFEDEIIDPSSTKGDEEDDAEIKKNELLDEPEVESDNKDSEDDGYEEEAIGYSVLSSPIGQNFMTSDDEGRKMDDELEDNLDRIVEKREERITASQLLSESDVNHNSHRELLKELPEKYQEDGESEEETDTERNGSKEGSKPTPASKVNIPKISGPTLKPAQQRSPDQRLTVQQIATMSKRRDFAIFPRKLDVLVAGGKAENGNFLDDIIRIIPATGKVQLTDFHLSIPLANMKSEVTAIHQNFLMQFFDASSCFYGD